MLDPTRRRRIKTVDFELRILGDELAVDFDFLKDVDAANLSGEIRGHQNDFANFLVMLEALINRRDPAPKKSLDFGLRQLDFIFRQSGCDGASLRDDHSGHE